MSSRSEPMSEDAEQSAASPAGSAVNRHPAGKIPDIDRRAARQLLGAIFIATGIAHLTHQRFYRTMLPYWLVEARREIDVATGTVEVFGGVVLFVPKLRNLARWTNLAVLAPTVPAVIRELRRPYRSRPFSQHRPALNPVGPLGMAPGHAGLAALLWWATAKD